MTVHFIFGISRSLLFPILYHLRPNSYSVVIYLATLFAVNFTYLQCFLETKTLPWVILIKHCSNLLNESLPEPQDWSENLSTPQTILSPSVTSHVTSSACRNSGDTVHSPPQQLFTWLSVPLACWPTQHWRRLSFKSGVTLLCAQLCTYSIIEIYMRNNYSGFFISVVLWSTNPNMWFPIYSFQ